MQPKNKTRDPKKNLTIVVEMFVCVSLERVQFLLLKTYRFEYVLPIKIVNECDFIFERILFGLP